VGAILVEEPNRRTHFGREPSNDYFIKIYFSLSKWFQTRRFLWEFPIGSYVKLSLAAAAILVGGVECRKQFWKGTIQGSLQQSLVEIGLVVSEEKIFSKFHPPFSLFLALRPSWLKVGITGHNFEGGYQRNISPKLGCNWSSGFWGED
jgi:hypothetical protein